MIPKPKHFGPEYALRFKDRSVADAYHLRVPYPAEVFSILSGLIVDESPTVLDVGLGAFHSMSSFSRESMGEELAIAFDYEVKQLISRFCKEGVVELQVVGKIVWGRPVDKESKI
jgi:hypothetical protein